MRLHGVSAIFTNSLFLPAFPDWRWIGSFVQSFPIPPKPGPSPWVLVNALVILAFIALSFIVYRRDERRRARLLTAIGAEMGLRFQRRGVVGPQAAKLPLFKSHPKAYAKNILSGVLPAGEALIFDYFCPTWAPGPQQPPNQPDQQTVAAFRFPNAELPLFRLQTREVLDRLPNWVRKLLGERYEDVTLDSNPEFSKRFLLQAKDVNVVRGLFTPEAACFLETLVETDWLVEASGKWMLVYRQLILLEAKGELYCDFINKASAIASAIIRGK